uniref:Small ribosomal subunit protein uS3m n=1 Tax=Epirixanthes elongata TaxID=1562316 RepID=A0A6B7FLP1_EPIEO|nr:ribosomal protein S3 [Epirixanthes elongata]QBB73134.1 ribosomal protein S3 [Epirixanthes elongata]
MARKGNPISVRLALNRRSDSSRFSDFYYGKSVYQDVNLRSYFGSIRPPTRLTFGFRIGRCIILHFTKKTFIHFFLPRRPRLKRAKSRPEKGRAFWKVGIPIGCLHSESSSDDTNERGRGAKRVESIRLDDREKQNERRIGPKKKKRYGYPSIKNLDKSLGVFKHPKEAGVVNDIALLISNYDSFRKTKLFKFFLPKKYRTSHLINRTLPAVCPYLNYSVMQYFYKKKRNFDPVVVLHFFVAPGVAQPFSFFHFTMGANAPGSFEKRIRSRITFFVESSTSEKCLAEAKKRLTHFIRQSNDLRFAVRTKTTTTTLFPFFGATLFFPRDGVGMYNNLKEVEDARERLIGQLRIKCWMVQVMELIDQFIDLGRIGELRKGIEMMISIRLRKSQIPDGYNSYFNEVKKMRSLLSSNITTNTLIESVKIKSVYQSASPIAQDISFKLRRKTTRSFRSIFSKIVTHLPLVKMKKGIRICCSGRLKGAEIARTECGKYGKTSRNVFNHTIDYASAEVSTRYGISGVKVWISYGKKGTCYIRNVRNFVNIVKADVGVANRTVHLVLEDMALKVVELVVFHIEPLKQRVGL